MLAPGPANERLTGHKWNGTDGPTAPWLSGGGAAPRGR
jgi:hypothetical protein